MLICKLEPRDVTDSADPTDSTDSRSLKQVSGPDTKGQIWGAWHVYPTSTGLNIMSVVLDILGTYLSKHWRCHRVTRTRQGAGPHGLHGVH
eukprot:6901206-Prymnesium_polylepis.3